MIKAPARLPKASTSRASRPRPSRSARFVVSYPAAQAIELLFPQHTPRTSEGDWRRSPPEPEDRSMVRRPRTVARPARPIHPRTVPRDGRRYPARDGAQETHRATGTEVAIVLSAAEQNPERGRGGGRRTTS